MPWSFTALLPMQIDLLYLHNPAEMIGDQQLFRKRMQQAFRYLEVVRQRGTIRTYGIATWDCFRTTPESASYVSLEELVQIAEEAGGSNHGFRCKMMHSALS